MIVTRPFFGAVSISSGKFFLNHQDGLGTTGTLSVLAGAVFNVFAVAALATTAMEGVAR